MPANEETKLEESIKAQPAAAELEKKTEEIQTDDADLISGGFSGNTGAETH